MRESRLGLLRGSLADGRGGRVLFVSHCVLNENVRYLGGAGRPAAVLEIVQAALDHHVGLVQMPCPEQRVWGGVLKRRMLATYGQASLASSSHLRRGVAAAAAGATAAAVVPLARQVAGQIEDYDRSGLAVVGVVGIGSSPSCGVLRTLNLGGALADVAACPIRRLNRETMTGIVAANARPGAGIFTAAVRRTLRRRNLAPPFFEHDLLAELAGGRALPDGLLAALATQEGSGA